MVDIAQKEFEYLNTQLLGRLATVSSTQNPHVTPVAFAVDDEHVYLNI